MTSSHLWWIRDMDEKWENKVAKKNRILLELQYIEDIASTNEGNIEQVSFQKRLINFENYLDYCC